MKEPNVQQLYSKLPTSITYLPAIPRRQFAALTKQTENTIRGLQDKGHLPSIKIGRSRWINIAKLHKQCMEHLELRK